MYSLVSEERSRVPVFIFLQRLRRRHAETFFEYSREIQRLRKSARLGDLRNGIIAVLIGYSALHQLARKFHSAFREVFVRRQTDFLFEAHSYVVVIERQFFKIVKKCCPRDFFPLPRERKQLPANNVPCRQDG